MNLEEKANLLITLANSHASFVEKILLIKASREEMMYSLFVDCFIYQGLYMKDFRRESILCR